MRVCGSEVTIGIGLFFPAGLLDSIANSMTTMNSRRFLIGILLAAACVEVCHGGQPDTVASRLWGREGERWTPTSRLPDFSYAGYHRGERELPTMDHASEPLSADSATAVSVKDFGAVGDGKTDDTEAFQLAVRKSPGKTIVIPVGEYVITDQIELVASGTVLRGVGPNRSVLRFPVPLNDVRPLWSATTTGQRTSGYSWSGGFLSVVGKTSAQKLADVTQPAARGENILHVSKLGSIRRGDEIRLSMSDDETQSLATFLYANDPGPIKNLGAKTQTSFIARVTGIDPKTDRIRIDRPLRTDVRLDWQPKLYPAQSSVEEVGIEGIGFEFPVTPYAGHFTEVGYNAIAMAGVRNCWVRNIKINNADSGIFLHGANVTLADVIFESQRPAERSRKATGHHGITLGGEDNLLVGFEFRTRMMHDITVTRGSAGNVASEGKGIDMCFDHHRYGPHANLFTNIDIGEGTRMFQSGGGAELGRHSAAWETFWCIRSSKPQGWPDGFGPDLMNIVGVVSVQDDESTSGTDTTGRWFEPIDPEKLQPANLYRAQLQVRLQPSQPRR